MRLFFCNTTVNKKSVIDVGGRKQKHTKEALMS